MNASPAEAAAAEAVRLRSRMEQGEEDAWAAPLPRGFDTSLLHHLPPPFPDPRQAIGPGVMRWRAAHQPGMCYHRRGPGFILVKDVRDPGAASRIVIDQEPLVAAFLRCAEPVRLDQAGDDLAALEFLLAENLLLDFGGLVVAAPYRMRRWPLPALYA